MSWLSFVGSHGFVYLYGLVFSVETDVARLNLLKYGGSRPYEGSFDVLLIFGWGLYIKHVIISGQFEGLLLRNHPLLHKIAFVANQNQNHIAVAVIFYVLNPPRHISEWFFAGYIENNQSSSWRTVVWSCDGFEFLLTCSVPDLQFDNFAIQHNVSACELYPHSVFMVGVEPIIDKSANNAGFANCSVTYKDELERIVKAVR